MGRNEAGALFEGGAGADSVGLHNKGTFNGGTGNDEVYEWNTPEGVFNGGPGNDVIEYANEGRFTGGPGDDRVTFNNLWAFNGGPGQDAVGYNQGEVHGRLRGRLCVAELLGWALPRWTWRRGGLAEPSRGDIRGGSGLRPRGR